MDERPPPPPPDLPAQGEQPPFAPPPVPPAEDLSGEDGGSRFKTVVAVLIAVASILSAVVAWRASAASRAAGDLDEQGTQEQVLQEQELASIEGLVANDQRLFARYQEHILAWRILQKQSRDTRAGNAALADSLDTEASAQLALARSLRRFFQGATPDFGNEEGIVEYNREFVLRNLRESNAALTELDPEATFLAAAREHDRTIRLVGVFTAVVAALFFLTIAQFAGSAIRGIFALAGAVVGLAGLIMLVLIETRVV